MAAQSGIDPLGWTDFSDPVGQPPLFVSLGLVMGLGNMNAKTVGAVRRVYSYIRFSTKEQSLGDSERRQIELAEQFAKRNNFVLDDSLRLTDRGMSGFSGANRTKGALGKFLAAVELGKVPEGSILLVENIDRLSREGAHTTLRNVIFKLWDHGIVLQTLTPEESYGPGCDSDPRFIGLLLYIQQARGESQRKSERMRASRDQSRQKARDGVILTGRGPAWLTATGVKGEREWKVDQLAKKTICQIYRWKRDGYSYRWIERKLNENPDKHWTRPNAWRASYVKKLLQNEAVIGIYQPYINRDGRRLPEGEPIPDYYPIIVDPQLFYAVQERFSANKGKGGQVGKAGNLFRHLVKCGYCGSAMAYVDKGPSPKGGQYLVCDNGRRGLGCKGTHTRYHECEKLILENCRKLDPSSILPNASEQATQCKQLRELIGGHEGKLAAIEKQIDNLIDQVASTDSKPVRGRYEAKIVKLESEKVTLTNELAAARRELSEAKRNSETLESWRESLAELQESITDTGTRVLLQTHLQELIKRIDVYFVGFPNDEPLPISQRPVDAKDKRLRHIVRVGESATDLAATFAAQIEETGLPKGVTAKEWDRFLGWVTDQQKTKAGRFLRVHFRSGAVVTIRPADSLWSTGLESAWMLFVR